MPFSLASFIFCSRLDGLNTLTDEAQLLIIIIYIIFVRIYVMAESNINDKNLNHVEYILK